MKFIATCGYSLEGTLNRELKALNMKVLDVATSRVLFEGEHADGCRAALMLRSAGRLMIQLKAFKAAEFDELFDGIYSLPWEKFIEKGTTTRVVARSVNSKLYSQRTVQSVVQKAIYKKICDKRRISSVYGQTKYLIDVLIHKDIVSLSLDMVGDPLHKRGYRVLNSEAALRETSSASLVLMSGWKYDRALHDPFCGSGTILIEAALAARNMAPGINRKFAAESFPWWSQDIWAQERQRCKDEVNREKLPPITGGDINSEVLSMAITHIKRAGVAGDIIIKKVDVADMTLMSGRGHIITNPPYGKRLMKGKDLDALYQNFSNSYEKYKGYSCHVITSYDKIERCFKRKADKTRKLYNGNLQTVFYQFYGKKIASDFTE